MPFSHRFRIIYVSFSHLFSECIILGRSYRFRIVFASFSQTWTDRKNLGKIGPRFILGFLRPKGGGVGPTKGPLEPLSRFRERHVCYAVPKRILQKPNHVENWAPHHPPTPNQLQNATQHVKAQITTPLRSRSSLRSPAPITIKETECQESSTRG